MSTPIASVGGLASGLQWQDLIEQIMTAESARRLAPLQAKEKAQNGSIDAWNGYQSVVSNFASALASLRDGSAFDALKLSGGYSPATGRTLFKATPSAAAAAGSYEVEVLQLAQAAKLGSAAQASTTDPLGVSGDFLINGRRIEISAADSLGAIRDRINAANSGSNATHVTATILSTSTGSNRLVLTSNLTGVDGIELVDGDTHALRSLGFLDGTLVANSTSDGGSESHRFTTATTAIATLLGVTLPPPSTVKVGDRVISVDLTTDSLASIAARIKAAGGSASVVDETVNGTSYSRLSVGSQVSVDPGDSTNSSRTLELLGFLDGGRSAVAQTLTSGTALGDAATSGTALGGTLITDLRNAGAGGLQIDDTIAIRGTRGDGTAASIDFTVTSSSTVDDLLAAINSAYGSGSRTAAATLQDGRIVLTDQQAGESQLSLSLTTTGAGSLDFGRVSTTTVGRSREMTAGANASMRVDGTLITRSSNTIADALSGITIDLQQAEVGTTVDLSLTHDVDGMVKALQAYASAYNDVLAFVKMTTAADGALPYDGSLRSSMATLTGAMLTDIVGLGGTSYTRQAIAGVTLTKTGTLGVDEGTLRDALTTNLADVRRLFATGGTTSSGELSYLLASNATQPGSYDVTITSAATTPSVTGSVLAGGVYADDATPDQLTITDSNGKNGSIQLADGDTIDDIGAKLNELFASNGMHLEASNVGGALKIAGTRYGSSESFTVAWSGGGTDSSAQLGVAADTYAGSDVQGTIGGQAAAGLGQTLTGPDGTPVEGLVVQYSGSAAGSVGRVNYVLGTAGILAHAIGAITRAGDGLVASQVGVLQSSNDYLDHRIDDVQHQLDLRQAALTKQFVAMEAAISKLQSQQAWLTSQIGALPGFAGGSQQS